MTDNNTKKLLTYQYCIVPKCISTSIKCPQKHFFSVPRIQTVREKWCKAMSRLNKGPIAEKSSLYVCEDHFNLETDTNMVQYRLVGGKLRLKPYVIPHRFECQKKQGKIIIKNVSQLRNNKSASSTSNNYNHVQIPDQTNFLNESKRIECLEAVVTYTSQMQQEVSNRGDLNSVVQANTHLVGLLEKVVCEWFDRAQRRKEIGSITDELFLQKAQETKEIFCLHTLKVDYAWLEKFKAKYDITEIDMRMLRIDNNVTPLPLDINDVVLHVLKINPLTEIFSNKRPEIETIKSPDYILPDNPIDEEIVVKIEDIEPIERTKQDLPYKNIILNDEQARLHLRPVEEYVLLKDNYRAIGLISQLMEIFSQEVKEEG